MFSNPNFSEISKVNINTKHFEQLEGVLSGIAIIAEGDKGQNSLIVVPGANGKLTLEDVDKAQADIANGAV